MNTQELAEKLAQYPVLKQRFEELVMLVDNGDSEMQRADVAEQRVIDSMRNLGHEALSYWVQKQAEQASHQAKKQLARACKHIKKVCWHTTYGEITVWDQTLLWAV